MKSKNTPKYQALLKWLKSQRLEQGATVRDVGLLIDEPFQIVSKIEKGQRKLSVDEYMQYCKALNVDYRKGLKLLE
ncbi:MULTISPECIES: helix-turn-helix domain-containing protein [Aliiglaciecola]|uniref:helix-turn-helix domain-containing protein n=1 Tax=Aliiglaciecola TaxID=1406885 RepID=UPI00209090CC|nr:MULTISPECIES: helix-turn-helix transcriptional regulator [Aliiglaciecola]MDO6711359.1 helix-turn-helix transcriptional regulator [Aliiglaciecola sp. 2_MG-2023]MDO6752192.1 helix-turn-helix transcriptional regulator [Aliiglaciecola sp. 1_MG-2023]